MKFELSSQFQPSGDQPEAIAGLVKGIQDKQKHLTLLGVTGSGKTFTMANVIAQTQRPTLVMSHNKTLTAQLASEFQEFFPKNAVHYFVSYYDYYQPEAYIARSDTYIEKETQINEEIDRLRHASIQAILSRRDVIIVASVSCIYGLGAPQDYLRGRLTITPAGELDRKQLMIRLVEMNYNRNDLDFRRATFRVRGDVIEVYQPSAENRGIRFDFFGDDLETIAEINALTGEVITPLDTIDIYPATLYQAQTDHYEQALQNIRTDLERAVADMRRAGKELEAHRLQQRVTYDLEMIENVGFVSGIENYSRYFDGRVAGEAPYTLFDYFSDDFLLVVDESHQTIPQIGGMYGGDRSRKDALIEHGFRMESARDNRPLTFEEFEQRVKQVVYVSATPGPYEHQHATVTVEQLIRPTGIVDPPIDVRPVKGQIPNLLTEIETRIKKGQRALVTTLTKRMAEELADFLNQKGVAVQYLHSDVDTMERLEILRDLRLGVYDVLVGINLLREGLDLPEVSLVAILDADKEGFLRSETALIQTMGRAARHVDGAVIMYADVITGSMQRAIDEVLRRRKIQLAYNQQHGITPQSTKRAIGEGRMSGKKSEQAAVLNVPPAEVLKQLNQHDVQQLVQDLQGQMSIAAQNLEFEKAATLRDQIAQIEEALGEGSAFRKKSRSRK